ncbi:MAG: hypothetical protein ACTSWY_08785 [Promethearchaeota archaeon]
MTKNNITDPRSYKAYLIGTVLNIISLFLPWYNFSIIGEGLTFNWTFFPFDGWVKNSDHPQILPDLSPLTMFYYIEIFYFAIVLSILIIYQYKLIDNSVNLDIENSSENSKIFSSLKKLGVFMPCFIFLYFLYLIISGEYYVPYIEINVNAGNLNHTLIYSVSAGSILNFFSSCIMIISVFMSKNTEISLKEYGFDENSFRQKDQNSGINPSDFDEQAEFSPMEEYQQLEDTFIETKNKAVYNAYNPQLKEEIRGV